MFTVTGLVDGSMFTHVAEPRVCALAERIRKALTAGVVFVDRHALAAAIGLKEWSCFPATLFRMGVTGHIDEGPTANGPYRWNVCRCEGGVHGHPALAPTATDLQEGT